jgi:hypothetical protein
VRRTATIQLAHARFKSLSCKGSYRFDGSCPNVLQLCPYLQFDFEIVPRLYFVAVIFVDHVDTAITRCLWVVNVVSNAVELVFEIALFVNL